MDIRHHKSVQAMNYFARKESGNSINRLKLIKLLWLADRYHIMRHGRIMLMDDYRAMPHGPVASDTLNISRGDFDEYTGKYISPDGHHVNSVNEVDTDYLSVTEMEAMDAVWGKFGSLNRYALKDLSHEYPEWKRYEAELLDNKKKSSYPMVIDDFFKAPDNKVAAMYDFFEGLESHIPSSKEVLGRRAILAG